jgi:hypothetical protein
MYLHVSARILVSASLLIMASIFSFLLLANQCTSSAYPRVNSFIPINRPQAPQHAA